MNAKLALVNVFLDFFPGLELNEFFQNFKKRISVIFGLLACHAMFL